MPYESPFKDVTDDHESVDPLCLSRTHHSDPEAATLYEFYRGVVAICTAPDADQAAFFMVRHFVELSLKTAIRSAAPATHDLEELLARSGLEAQLGPGHDLIAFIRDLHARDPRGDAGRYARHRDGALALAPVCCADRDRLIALATELFALVM